MKRGLLSGASGWEAFKLLFRLIGSHFDEVQSWPSSIRFWGSRLDAFRELFSGCSLIDSIRYGQCAGSSPGHRGRASGYS